MFRMHRVVSFRRRVQGGVLRAREGHLLFLSPTLFVCVICVFVRRVILLNMCIVTGYSDMVIIDNTWDYG